MRWHTTLWRWSGMQRRGLLIFYHLKGFKHQTPPHYPACPHHRRRVVIFHSFTFWNPLDFFFFFARSLSSRRRSSLTVGMIRWRVCSNVEEETAGMRENKKKKSEYFFNLFKNAADAFSFAANNKSLKVFGVLLRSELLARSPSWLYSFELGLRREREIVRRRRPAGWN